MMGAWRNPNTISFSAAVEQFRRGRRTPRDFLEACLARIDECDARIRAFVVLNVAAARRQADASTQRYRRGAPLSSLDGCPVGVKDIIATADMPTQMNSSLFLGWQSGQDAACVHALRQGGAVILGKTVTTEFAIGCSGPTINPFDATRTPGGSSSGTAAAVGSGMLPVGLGTQTGGSTLRPASYCGVVGFKPTLGALHTGGIHPLSATCDHLGVIGGNLADTWRSASHISLALGSPGYGFMHGAATDLPPPLSACRLIWLHTRGWREIDAPTEHAFQGILTALQGQGVEIISQNTDARVANFEEEIERDIDGAGDIVAYELQWPFVGYIARHGEKIGPRIRELVARAGQMTPAAYVDLLQKRRAALQRCEALLATLNADGFITLASSGPAPRGLEHTGSRSFLTFGSWLGLPAFSLPLMEVSGLPVGLQVLGLPHQDGRLCALAHGLMRDCGGVC